MSAVQRAQRPVPPEPKSNALPVADAGSAAANSIAQKSFARVAGRWLRWQCQLLNDVKFAAVIDATGLSDGAGIAADAIVCQIGTPAQPLIVSGTSNQHKHSTQKNLSSWQVPIKFPNRDMCVLFHIGSLKKPEQAAVDRLLRWGVLNLTDWLSDAQANPAPSMPPVELMLAQKNLDQAAARWVDNLQRKTETARVSIGWSETSSTRLLAVSGVATLDTQRDLPRELAGALGECVKASDTVTYPQSTESSSELVKHQSVFERGDKQRLVSVPLILENVALGAVMFELKDDQDIAKITDIFSEEAALAVPVLATLSERKPGLKVFVLRALNRIRQVLFNPATPIQKMTTAALLLVSLIALLFPFSFSATARGEIQGSDRQVLAAAHAGILKSTSARAGDSVSNGQVLAKFDHTQLKLERDTWLSELTRIDAALVQAMSSRDRSAVGRLRAEQSSAKAEVELIDHRIFQSDIVAPFEGILVSGDLDDRLGASIEVGESLFQIASLDDYTLQLEVPEQHAAKVNQGSTGDMRFAALPSQKFSFSVESMVPVAITENGSNVFRMQASLVGNSENIRPGMTGVAKVTLGRRALLLRGIDFFRHRAHYWWWSFGA